MIFWYIFGVVILEDSSALKPARVDVPLKLDVVMGLLEHFKHNFIVFGSQRFHQYCFSAVNYLQTKQDYG